MKGNPAATRELLQESFGDHNPDPAPVGGPWRPPCLSATGGLGQSEAVRRAVGLREQQDVMLLEELAKMAPLLPMPLEGSHEHVRAWRPSKHQDRMHVCTRSLHDHMHEVLCD